MHSPHSTSAAPILAAGSASSRPPRLPHLDKVKGGRGAVVHALQQVARRADAAGHRHAQLRGCRDGDVGWQRWRSLARTRGRQQVSGVPSSQSDPRHLRAHARPARTSRPATPRGAESGMRSVASLIPASPRTASTRRRGSSWPAGRSVLRAPLLWQQLLLGIGRPGHAGARAGQARAGRGWTGQQEGQHQEPPHLWPPRRRCAGPPPSRRPCCQR